MARQGSNFNLTREPLHLLAIVNRLDLRDTSKGSYGELRFVYGTVPTGAPFTNDMKIILEYTVPAAVAADVRTWAIAWHTLASASQSTDYVAQLTTLTNQVTQHAGVTYRLRTGNESFDTAWTFRQFEPVGGALVARPLAQTPDRRFMEPVGLSQNQAAGTPQTGSRCPSPGRLYQRTRAQYFSRRL